MNLQILIDRDHDGMWKQNPGMVQLLGMCPLLAVSGTVVNGVSLGLATAVVMALQRRIYCPQ